MNFVRSLALIATLLPLSLKAQQGQVVGPGGTPLAGNATPWTPSVQAGGLIGATTANPCGLAASGACSGGYGAVGAGSLEMRVSGVRDPLTGQYPDWAFWYTYAGGSAASGQSYGSLADLSAMSFDWYREGTDGWDTTPPAGEQPINPIDWRYKTPVLRLQLRETNGAVVTYSELVWEGYYNQCKLGPNVACNDNYTTVDEWVRQADMQADNFWFIRPPAIVGLGDPPALPAACGQSLSFWSGGVQTDGISSLLAQCFTGETTVDVIGVAVGVGSQWPLPYHGFVDNVRLGFTGDEDLALDANFDFVQPGIDVRLVTTTPEPSTYALMGAGLLALGVAARRRRNKK